MLTALLTQELLPQGGSSRSSHCGQSRGQCPPPSRLPVKLRFPCCAIPGIVRKPCPANRTLPALAATVGQQLLPRPPVTRSPSSASKGTCHALTGESQHPGPWISHLLPLHPFCPLRMAAGCTLLGTQCWSHITEPMTCREDPCSDAHPPTGSLPCAPGSTWGDPAPCATPLMPGWPLTIGRTSPSRLWMVPHVATPMVMTSPSL